MVKRMPFTLAMVSMLTLQSCQSLQDYLQNYVGSLWSPTVGDMIYLKSANDPFMFGKQSGTINIQETLSYNFLVSQYEITNAAFKSFIDAGGYSNQNYWTTAGWAFVIQNGLTEPLYWSDPAYNAADQPVVGVSWYEAVAFTQWLSLNEGFSAAYDWDGFLNDLYYSGYRLPTEVEWEYAASKGDPSETDRTFAWGNGWNCGKAVDRVPPCDAYISGPQPVGSRSHDGNTPQAVADMTGNVAEMVSDTFQSAADISTIIVTDRYIYEPDPLAVENYSVQRGGNWSGSFGLLFETSYREIIEHSSRSNTVGFRVVRTYPNQQRP